MPTHPLVGTWRLVSCETRRSKGHVNYPWGPDASGYILYTENGYMFVTITSANRKKFAAGDIKGGSLTEKATAAETYLSYCSSYEIQGDSVIHHVELSLFPNWIGVDQERLMKFEENRLFLTTKPILLSGMQQTAHMVWERV